jgi:hypothetical protein
MDSHIRLEAGEQGSRGAGEKGTPLALSPAPPLPHPGQPSALRAWLALVWLSWLRQARLRQMVAIALLLLAFAVFLVVIYTALGAWSMRPWRYPYRQGPTYAQWADQSQILFARLAGYSGAPGDQAIPAALLGSCRAILHSSGFMVFTRWFVFSVFVNFLLPLWSLSFATEAFGGEREANTMVWLLTRPLPRPAIYLAKYLALLPWTLGLNIGGFGLLCLAAGAPGRLAFELFWPAVFWATLAFSSLFCLMGVSFRRPAIVALVYAFFLEVLFGNLPGYLKRVSVGFFTRCMMYEAASDFGVQPQKPSVLLPIDGTLAAAVLAGTALVLLLAGMVVFSRSQFHEVV